MLLRNIQFLLSISLFFTLPSMARAECVDLRGDWTCKIEKPEHQRGMEKEYKITQSVNDNNVTIYEVNGFKYPADGESVRFDGTNFNLSECDEEKLTLYPPPGFTVHNNTVIETQDNTIIKINEKGELEQTTIKEYAVKNDKGDPEPITDEILKMFCTKKEQTDQTEPDPAPLPQQ